MKTKNLVLTAMSLSLLVGCKKQEEIETKIDYKKKLEQEFNLTSTTSSNKMSSKESKAVHNFATYEEQYKYLKELVKNTVIYDTVVIYPSKTSSILNSPNELKLMGKNNNTYATTTDQSITGVEQNYYSQFLSKSAKSSVTNTFTLSYSVSTTVNWPWKKKDASSDPVYLGYSYFSDTNAYGPYLTYAGFMQLTNYNVVLSANGGGGTANGAAQLYATTGGFTNSVSVGLQGSFTLASPGSPQSPLMIYYTFTATEPTLP
ncbi:hypothetical protein [Sphingobacterium multivorum]|uniref:hypothetical protein n=1 Tax=Sphingobacterium multivorum TaxID=28454 RepID=UPI002897E498|nr:hypothetical protein [Sphingobacterium multivorum]